jgi:mono/diheme cytochrome c family protein
MNKLHTSARRIAGVAGVVLAATLVASCRQDMHDAPRYDPLETSTVLPKGSSAQPLVAGTVPRGFLRENEHLNAGKVNGQPAATFPFAITRADLDRGQERFTIYCAPCHGATGEGDGIVIQRGFARKPPSYHSAAMREAPVGRFFEAMTNGFGAMSDYSAQVTVEDRWRIAAYIRALQLSQNAAAADVPAADMQRLSGGQPPAAAAPQKGHEE